MIKKYRKKPVVIEAVQFDGDNSIEVVAFMGMAPIETNVIMIDTLEGLMTVSTDDYIIKGIEGEFYPCKPEIFKKTYKEVK